MIKDGELRVNKSRCANCGSVANIIRVDGVPLCTVCAEKGDDPIKSAAEKDLDND